MSVINLTTLQTIRSRFEEVQSMMSQPEIATDPTKIMELGREHSDLKQVVVAIDTYEKLLKERDELIAMVASEDDEEMVELAKAELVEVEKNIPKIEDDLSLRLIPKDPADSKNAIVEIRAGTGGDEAALFAGDLYRLYSHFADSNGWKVEVMAVSEGTKGGYKEIILGLSGNDAFGMMKYESGVHRVQRVPATESSGRIHTSAATVAVLPEAEKVDLSIDPHELKIDVYRSSGPGGQSVNTTDSAVRITHIPTGLVVTCQDEKSQHKNKDKAMRVLRSRLYEVEQEKIASERSEARRSMVSTGDRSAKIRTYNWPQGRVTDHRLSGDSKNYALESVIGGDLTQIINALRTADNAERLAGI